MKNELIIKKTRDKHHLGLFNFCKDVAEDFGKLCGVEMETMVSKNRKRIPTTARQLTMYALTKLGIDGRYICWFFNRERTSIYYSLKSANLILDTEKEVLEYTNNIINTHEQRRISKESS